MKSLLVLGLVGLLVLSALALARSVYAVPDNTYTVNSQNDVNDGTCNGAHCSLREAINAANAHAGLDAINFEIGGCPCIIYPLNVLPPITDGVVINGYTEDGSVPADLDNPAVLMVTLRGSLAPNLTGGLRITGGNTTVKGLVINDFDTYGIWLSEGDGNNINGNFIGTFASGLTASSNGRGILISHGSHSNTIGGNLPAAQNMISGNSQVGIELSNEGGGADHNVIVSNIIGLNKVGDPLGNGIGILVRTKKNLIGSDSALILTSNSIGGNSGAGIELDGPAAKGNVLGLNLFGSFQSAAGNGTYGVLIHNGASKNKIGKSKDVFNFIANNGVDGIAVIGDNSKRNSIRANKSFGNGGLGIDLGDDGVTPNDALDADVGPNNRQNFPVLAKAVAQTHRVKGKLVGRPLQTFKIDLFQPFLCAPLGYGEGFYVDTVVVNTNKNGIAKFDVWLQDGFDPQYGMTATATDAKGNTSEYSKCITVTP